MPPMAPLVAMLAVTHCSTGVVVGHVFDFICPLTDLPLIATGLPV